MDNAVAECYDSAVGSLVYLPAVGEASVVAIHNMCEPLGEQELSLGDTGANPVQVQIFSLEKAREAIAFNLLVDYSDVELLRELSKKFSKIALRELTSLQTDKPCHINAIQIP